MDTGFAIALAWPETQCKQAGAWYDPLMRLLGFNHNGYYKVGHAAVILISDEYRICEYFDFGRYHAPYKHGRVRDRFTDHDLTIQTLPLYRADKESIINLNEILAELYQNTSCHGSGPIYATSVRINFEKSFSYAKNLQKQGFLKYGPFVSPGTNCSRFVSKVLQSGINSLSLKARLIFQPTLTPTPFGNLKALTTKINCYSSNLRIKEKTQNNFQLQSHDKITKGITQTSIAPKSFGESQVVIR